MDKDELPIVAEEVIERDYMMSLDKAAEAAGVTMLKLQALMKEMRIEPSEQGELPSRLANVLRTYVGTLEITSRGEGTTGNYLLKQLINVISVWNANQDVWGAETRCGSFFHALMAVLYEVITSRSYLRIKEPAADLDKQWNQYDNALVPSQGSLAAEDLGRYYDRIHQLDFIYEPRQAKADAFLGLMKYGPQKIGYDCHIEVQEPDSQHARFIYQLTVMGPDAEKFSKEFIENIDELIRWFKCGEDKYTVII